MVFGNPLINSLAKPAPVRHQLDQSPYLRVDVFSASSILNTGRLDVEVIV